MDSGSLDETRNTPTGKKLTKVVDLSQIVAERMLPTMVASRTFFLP